MVCKPGAITWLYRSRSMLMTGNERHAVRVIGIYPRVGAVLASIAAIVASVAVIAAESTQVTDEASAIAAAKRYTKARCSTETPCEYRARREGKQWNVFVEFKKRNQAGKKAQP